MLNKKGLALFLIALTSVNDAYKILVIFPLCSKSHNNLGKGVVNNLLDAGHEVVYFTCFADKEKRPNLTEIDFSHIEAQSGIDKDMEEQLKIKNMVGKKNFADSLFFMYVTYEIHRSFLNDDVLINFLSDTNHKFDAVVAEWFFSELLSGIAPLFQSHMIWFATTEAHWQILRIVDDIPSPAYTTELFSENIPPLDFLQRAKELWSVIKKYVILNFVVMPFEQHLYNKVYTPIGEKRGIKLPYYYDAAYNGSLLLLNSHPSIGTPFRLPQNAHYVAGFHIDTKTKPLPENLQKLMNEAKHGVIYFSMGSNLKSMDMSDLMRDSLLKMFSELKQTVIWKFESDLDKVPKNIHLTKWAPQQSVLAHPNLKMFITHGGQLSTTEAIYFGVPVVGIPVFGDQYVNMKSAVEKGVGITVTLHDNMAGELSAAIREILNNPSYSKTAKELSSIFHDRPMPLGKELVYWVEHVIRTGGARHLRSPAINVPLYQKLYLDLLLIVALILYVTLKVLRRLFRKITSVKVKKS
ncbi:unnamed protein product [Chilo suppressalis]|uniref:UDP-glucuronosyltransferase n=1 Tax=Chilo suppressalis TaxID=168631 RepID=A0ABN8B2E9_CHISP|nr:unnamed protein product [Chilo suppressalis]